MRHRHRYWVLFVALMLAVGFGIGFRWLGKSSGSDRSDPISSFPAPSSTIAAEERVAETTGTKPQHERVVVLAPEPIAAERLALLKSLKPREKPPKEELRIPQGDQLRLTVKLADTLRARVSPQGGLIVRSGNPSSIEGFQKLAAQRQLGFRRAQTVSDEQLEDLELRAARNSGQAQPDLAGTVEIRAENLSREGWIDLASALHALPEIEYAELESLDRPPPPPAVDIAPVTPLLVGNQTYRGASIGVNVDHVWNTYGIRGAAGLRVTDCEYHYNSNHEDLSGLVSTQPNVVSTYTGFGDEHATAVLGILASGNNGYGTTGSVPECNTWFYPEYSNLTTGFQGRAACVTAAIANSSAGDIVILEMQTSGPGTGGYVPAEYELGVWNAVKTGSDAGVIVIAAAGNGSMNLGDNSLFASYHARGNSGAIIVGAASSARTKSSFSTYGPRVNLQGWGGGVFTTGYGTYATYGGDPNQEYTSGFSGTSSATPIVASAAALLQSVAIRICQTRLTPAEMRQILVSTGLPQTGSNAATEPIGPRPELQAAVQALFTAHPPSFGTLESWSLYHFGTSDPGLSADPDLDGAVSLLEYVMGTNPEGNNPGDSDHFPRVSVEQVSPGISNLVIEFHQPAARTGAAWKLQQSTGLDAGSWSDLTSGVNGVLITRTGDWIRATLPADGAARFVRHKVTSN